MVDNPDDQNVAAVATARAASIINDPAAIHVRWPIAQQTIGKWQPIYPESKECKAGFVQGKQSDNSGYIWNLWRRYSCDMSEPGVYLFTAYFSPICIPNS